jgi:oligopeptide transport system substrate-binding protein
MILSSSRKYAAAFTLLVCFLGVASCTEKEDDGDLMVLHTSIREDISGWDPATIADAPSMNLASLVHETLFQYAFGSDRYEVAPLLAADLPKYSADRLTVTIPIRRSVRFHDDPAFKEASGKGRELKAQDFVYALKRLAIPGLRSSGWWLIDGRIEGLNAFRDSLEKVSKAKLKQAFDAPVSGIRAIDDATLEIKLTKPFPALLHFLSMTYTAPIAAEVVAEYAGDTMNIPSQAVGTGPFRLESWSRGKKIVFERNKAFHPDFYPAEGALEFRKRGLFTDAGKVLPFLDRISVRVIPDPSDAWDEFIKGRIDIMAVPKTRFLEAIVNHSSLSPSLAAKGARLHVETGATFWYVSFNMRDPLVGANKHLRQAISSALNRKTWVNDFTNGTGRIADGYVPPKILDRADVPLKYDFNLAHAGELLVKAGYPGGQGLPTLNFDLRGADQLNRQLGEFFSEQLLAIGIRVNVIYNSFPAFIEKMKEGKLQLSHGGWTLDYPDPENVFQLLYGPKASPGPNDSNFNNAVMNKMFEELAVMQPGPKRAALVEKMETLAQEETPWALGYYQVNYHVTQAWVQNYRPAELIWNKLKYLQVDRAAKRRYVEQSKRP